MFKSALCITLSLIATLSFSQVDCNCDIINKKDRTELINQRDSTAIFNAINKLKGSNSEYCIYQGLELEFKFHLDKLKLEKARAILNKQEKLIDQLSCEYKFDYNNYLNNTLYYRAANDFEKLSEFSFKALKEAEKLKDVGKEIEVIKEIVFLFTRMKENEKRWYYVRRSEKLILNQEKSIQSIANYRWLAFEYENQYTKTERKTLIDSTLLFINRSKKGAIEHKMFDELALLYRALEACSYHKRDLEKALVYIDSAIYYGKKIKGRKNLSGLYLSKAWDHLDLGEFNDASKWMDTALFYDNKSDIAGYMMMLSEASEIYESSGKLDKAYHSFKNYSKLKDSLISKQRIKVVNDLEAKYKSEIKDTQIKRLVVLLIVATLVILCILFIGTIVRLKRTKQKNEALTLAFENQIRLEKELSDVRDEIAQDFHDDLGNKLARISLLSNLVSGEASLNEAKAKSKLIQITEDANGLYTGTRDFIFSLKSNSDYLNEVVVYLSDFGEEFFNKTNVNFELNREISKNQKLPYHWSKQLIYIFKEAMTNALKHSDCDKVILKFQFEDDQLNIECIDNGIGLSDDNLNSSNGIFNMRKRAKRINGDLVIETNKDIGTTIKFLGKTNK